MDFGHLNSTDGSQIKLDSLGYRAKLYVTISNHCFYDYSSLLCYTSERGKFFLSLK